MQNPDAHKLTPETAKAFRAKLDQFARTLASPIPANRADVEAEARRAVHIWVSNHHHPEAWVATLARMETSEWPRELHVAALRAVTWWGQLFERAYTDLRERALAVLASTQRAQQVHVYLVLRMIDRAEKYAIAVKRWQRWRIVHPDNRHTRHLEIPRFWADGKRNDNRVTSRRLSRAEMRPDIVSEVIARIVAPDLYPAKSIAETFNTKLRQFCERVTQNAREKSPAHADELRESAISAALLWISSTGKPQVTIDRLTFTAPKYWPVFMKRVAQQAVRGLLKELAAEPFVLAVEPPTGTEKQAAHGWRCAALRAQIREAFGNDTSRAYLTSLLGAVDRAESYARGAIGEVRRAA